MIHTNMPRNCVVLLLRTTRSTIDGSQKIDSHKWPTVLIDEVKGKPRNSSDTCVVRYILLLKYLSNHIFYNKRFQTLFKDQLDRSKATCSFNTTRPRTATSRWGLHLTALGNQPKSTATRDTSTLPSTPGAKTITVCKDIGIFGVS